MEGLKQSKQALGAEVISRFNDFAPPTLLAQAARINFSTRLFNLTVTNVPGPAGAALRARARARGHLPGRLPAAEPGALRGDHELQRRHQLRPARRLRRDGRRRRDRPGIETAIAELVDAAAAASGAEAEATARGDERRETLRRRLRHPQTTQFHYHLELTPAQLKITHTARLSRLPDEHAITTILETGSARSGRPTRMET